MNILLLVTTYYPYIGGIEQVVHSLGRWLHQAGHRVVIISERKPFRLPANETIDELPVYRFPFTAAGLSIHGSLLYPVVSAWVVRQMQQLVEQYAIDLVHTQGVSRNAAYAMQLSRLTQTPLVATFQGIEVQSIFHTNIPPRLYRWQRYWNERIVAAASRVTTCSHDLGQQLVRLAPSAAAKLTVIHNGVDLAPFVRQPASEREHLLLIGRVVHKKGFDIALRAFAMLKQQRPTPIPHLVIAGDGPERAKLQALAGSLNIQDKTRWLGAVTDRDQIARLFAKSRVVLVPSREEPFGIVCLEALAAGCPVVASRVGGIPEIVRDGIDGLLVPPEDPAAMAEALGRMLDQQTTVAPPATLQERAAQFSWDQIGARYLELYQQVGKL